MKSFGVKEAKTKYMQKKRDHNYELAPLITNVPLFNPKILLEIGNQDFVHKTINNVIQAMKTKIQVLENAIFNEDQLVVDEISHWMKGSLGTCGLYHVAYIASEINVACKKNCSSQELELYNQLKTDWCQTQTVIKNYFSGLNQ